MASPDPTAADGPSGPRAAVCIPTWEPDLEHLRAAVAGALAQAEVDVEVVVADDASATVAGQAAVTAVEGLGGASVVRAAQHRGLADAWNVAVRAAGAPVVVVPGQDDVLRPGMLRTHLSVHATPGVVAVASAAAMVDDDGRPMAAGRLDHRRRALLAGRDRLDLDGHAAAAAALVQGNVLGTPAQVTFTRDAFEAVGGFSGRYEHAADLDLWLRLARQGTFVLLASTGCTRRVHPRAATATHRRSGAAARDRDRLLADHGHLLSPADRARARRARMRWTAGDLGRVVRTRVRR